MLTNPISTSNVTLLLNEYLRSFFMETLLILFITGKEEIRMNQQQYMHVHMFSIYSQPILNLWLWSAITHSNYTSHWVF